MLKGLGNLGDMARMMKTAQEMQTKLADLQEALATRIVTGARSGKPVIWSSIGPA